MNNGRKLVMFKDSFGNALVPFLLNSFEEICVVDMRYFELNAIDYIQEKGATDVLFADCVFTACGGNRAERSGRSEPFSALVRRRAGSHAPPGVAAPHGRRMTAASGRGGIAGAGSASPNGTAALRGASGPLRAGRRSAPYRKRKKGAACRGFQRRAWPRARRGARP